MSRPFSSGFRLPLYGPAVVLALVLRFAGLDWGAFHPDEWAVGSTVQGLAWPSSAVGALSADSPLNPGSFNYGSLPIYLLRAASETAGLLRGTVPFVPSDIVVWRAVSGLADLATLAVCALIARRLFREPAGILAAFLYAVAVLPIQLSHFHAVDPLMTAFTTAAAGAALLFVSGASVRWGFAAAALAGLAVAVKATAVLFAVPVVLAWAVFLLRERRARNAWSPRLLALGGGAMTLAVAASVAGQPYAMLDWAAFRDDVYFQTQMARGEQELPFTIQYLRTTPFLYHLRNLVVWGLGWPLGIAALAAVVWLLVRGVRNKDMALVLLAAGILVPFALLGGQQVKFMRYLLPLYPLLIVAASGLLATAARPLWSRGGRARWAAAALVAGIVVPTGFYGVAFSTVYAVTHPVQRMAEWIQDNVPTGTAIAFEAWDQGFPGSERYRAITVHPYNADDARKADHLAEVLDEADYVFLFSNRAYGALPRLPERYPLMREYYRQLLTGGLGFEIAHVEATYPTLLGVTFADRTLGPLGLSARDIGLPPHPGLGTLVLGPADESFTVYDHPKTVLLRKRTELGRDELRSRLQEGLRGSGAGSPPGLDPLLSMTPERARAQREGGSWTAVFADRGLPAAAPLLVWLLAVQAIAFVGFPLTTRVFRALPDRGYLLGKTLSLLLAAYVAWLLVSLGVVSFSRTAVIVSIVLLASASALIGFAARREILEFVRARWRLLLTMEMLFLFAFLAFTLLRAANPDLWHSHRGGEKPMDLAYLTAVVRSTSLPPYDPWFAGGFLNYYYFGQFVVATLVHLTGIVPEVAFNLAVPLLWAMTLGGCVSVVYNLVEASNVPLAFPRGRLRGALGAGVLAATLVGLAGNLDGGIQVVQQFMDGMTGGVVPSALHALSGADFDYWRSSRMVDVPGSISITEFPFFSFLFADLHAHLIAMPMTLLAAGLALAAALAVHRRSGAVTRLLPIALLGLTIGALFATNAWDAPAYVVVGVGAVAVAFASRGTPLRVTAMYAGLTLGAVGLIAFVAFASFHASNTAFYTSLARSPEQTPVHSYLAIFGLPLFVLLAALAVRLRGTWKGREPLAWLAAVAVALAAAVVWTAGYQVVALNVVLIAGIAVAARAPDAGLPDRLALATAGLALALVAGVDLYAVDDRLVRMNTIFRVYLQAWVFLGLAAGFLLWRLWHDGLFGGLGRSLPRTAFAVGLAALVLAAGVYPVLGTRARLADRFGPTRLTLDGLAYADSATYRDVGDTVVRLDAEIEGIEWLRRNVDGSPVVAEAALPPYPDDVPYFRFLSRVAVYTGLPIVVGWPWHQQQQRGVERAGPILDARIADVRRLFTAEEPAEVRRLLGKYEIEYIVVGQMERFYYPAEGLAVFDAMPELERHDINGLFTVFRVRGPASA